MRDARFVLGGDRHAPAKIVVIACNTATAYGLDAATEVARPGGVKVIGVVNAGVAATLDALKAKSGMAPTSPSAPFKKMHFVPGMMPSKVRRMKPGQSALSLFPPMESGCMP